MSNQIAATKAYTLAAGALSLLLSAAPPALADDADLARATATIHGEAIAEHVKVLASDRFEGRAPGTEGETLTLAYITDAFRGLGLQPAYGKTYLQPVPLVEVEQSAPGSLRVTAGGKDVPLAAKDDFVTRFGAPAAAVAVKDSGLVFVGYGLVDRAQLRDDDADVDLTGKTVVILQAAPPASLSAAAPAPSSKLSERLDAAARRGARAALVVHTEASLGYSWSVLASGGLGAKAYFLKPDGKARKLEAVVYLSEPGARRLFGAAGLDFDGALKRASQPGFRPAVLAAAADITETARLREIVSHNVVAVAPGSEPAAGCFVFMAHWDHMGRDPSLMGDQIFNGAVDNATGVGALLEIGRALRAMPTQPRRTIVLVATTAEERGLLGSEYLADHPVCPIAQTVGAVAIDAVFPYGPWDRMSVTGFGSSELEDELAASAANFGRKLQGDGQPQAGLFFRADNYPFSRRGVPGFLAVGGPDNNAPDTDPQARAVADYVLHKYHHPSDEYDPTWDMRGVEGDARTLFRFAWTVANDLRVPNWYWTSPYRTLRDDARDRGDKQNASSGPG